MDLSIAIVSYNTRDLLLACLRSIRDTTRDLRYEVIVVDNASRDGSAEAARAVRPPVQVIANAHNEGYAKACNQAAAAAQGRHVLLLNSDTIMQVGTLRAMVELLDREESIGIVSPLQRNGAGAVLRSCFPFPSLRDHLRHTAWLPAAVKPMAGRAREVDVRRSQDVDWANGACLMIRRELLRRCGGLDEQFFMYFEDVDLCRAVHRLGYRVRHLAEAEVVHLVGRSSGERAKLNVEWELSRIRYIEKHFPPAKRWIMKGWIAGGAAARTLCGLIHRDGSGTWTPAVWRSLVQRLWSGARAEASVRAAASAALGG